MRLTPRRTRELAVTGLVPVAVLVAACGSSASPGSPALATATNASDAAHVALSVASGAVGRHLVGPNGHAVYLWEGDRRDVSRCSGTCREVWPAVSVSGKPSVGRGVHGDEVGTLRIGGRRQLTYGGHPLYYYSGDTGAGSTSGQGNDGFGARWWLVTPSGSALIRSTASSGATSGPTSRTSGSGGSGGGSGW